MTGDGDGAFWSAAVGVGVIIILRIVDWIMPQGHHFKFVDRWADDDGPQEQEPEDDY
jgi:hypothetical protein